MPEEKPVPLADQHDDDFVDDMLDEGLDIQEGAPDTEPEAPTEPEAATAEPEAAPAEPAPSAQPRDPSTGRFLPKDEAEAAAPAATPEQPPAESTEQRSEAAPAPAPEYPALTYTAGGREYELSGSQVRDDGVYIPTAAVPQLQLWLGRGQVGERRVQDLQRELAAAKDEGQLEVERARKIVDAIDELIQQDPEAIAQWLENYKANYESIKLRAENAALKAQSERSQSRAQEYELERQAEQMVPLMRQELDRTLDQLAEKYPQVDRQRMFERLTSDRLVGAVFPEADRDYPEWGIQKGNLVIDYGFIEQEYEHAAALAGAAQTEAETARANAEAVRGSPAPPAVGASGTEPPTTEEEIPDFKSKDEMDAWFEKKYG